MHNFWICVPRAKFLSAELGSKIKLVCLPLVLSTSTCKCKPNRMHLKPNGIYLCASITVSPELLTKVVYLSLNNTIK